MTDWLELERLVVDKVQGLNLFKLVGTLADVDQAPINARQTPACMVAYTGFSPTQKQGNGTIQEIELRLAVVVVVRNLSDNTGAGARVEAGPLIFQTATALIGWRPAAGYEQLQLSSAGNAAYDGSGTAVYPLGFTSRTTIRRV